MLWKKTQTQRKYLHILGLHTILLPRCVVTWTGSPVYDQGDGGVSSVLDCKRPCSILGGIMSILGCLFFLLLWSEASWKCSTFYSNIPFRVMSCWGLLVPVVHACKEQDASEHYFPIFLSEYIPLMSRQCRPSSHSLLVPIKKIAYVGPRLPASLSRPSLPTKNGTRQRRALKRPPGKPWFNNTMIQLKNKITFQRSTMQ